MGAATLRRALGPCSSSCVGMLSYSESRRVNSTTSFLTTETRRPPLASRCSRPPAWMVSGLSTGMVVSVEGTTLDGDLVVWVVWVVASFIAPLQHHFYDFPI